MQTLLSKAAPICCLGAGLLLAGPAARANDGAYPTHPIRLIVPFAVGGGSDILARILAPAMSERLGQQIVVENRPGASTNIAAELVAKARPDGYTLMLGNTNTFVVNGLLFKSLNYDPVKDFSVLGMAGAFPMILAVSPSVPARSVAEFVSLAKDRAGTLSYASPGVGTPHHLAMEMLKFQSGIQATHVSYKGVAPALPDLMVGRVQAIFIDYAAGGQQLKAGKLRGLAVGSQKPTEFMPELPTMAASGFPTFDVTGWQGMVVPKGTPDEIVRKLTDALRATMASAEVKESLRNAGIEPAYMAPPEFGRYIDQERGKMTALIKAANIQLDTSP